MALNTISHTSCSSARCSCSCSTVKPPPQPRRCPYQYRCHAIDPETAHQIIQFPVLADTAAVAAAAAVAGTQPGVAAAAEVVPLSSTYTPGPVEVGWQIWFAAAVSTVPFVIGAYEFGKRILIQRRCKVCSGSGLVHRGRFQRKCPECGGFFPWISWSMFLSANARPGNGGPLLQPRGQTSVFYTVPPAQDDAQQQQDSSSQHVGDTLQQSNASTSKPEGQHDNSTQPAAQRGGQ